MNVNIYHKHKDIIITTFIIASRAYLQQTHGRRRPGIRGRAGVGDVEGEGGEGKGKSTFGLILRRTRGATRTSGAGLPGSPRTLPARSARTPPEIRRLVGFPMVRR